MNVHSLSSTTIHTAGSLFNRPASLGHSDALGSNAANRDPVRHRPAASRPASSLQTIGRATVTGPFLVRILFVVVRRQALALVNRRLRHGDLDVGADWDPEAIRLGHDELDHADLDTVRRLDDSVEPERSQPDDVKPCVRWRVIADVR